MHRRPVRRALVSVYDKTGLEDLARGLHDAGVALVSTGSTAARIAAAGRAGDPGRGGHRLPRVPRRAGQDAAPGGARRASWPTGGSRATVAQLAELGIEPFDLVVVNLYPFAATVASGATPDECVEQIDIGGPAMVRSAAKNHPSVAVVVDPARYPDVLAAVAAGGFTLDQRRRLAAAAFAHTASYDVAVASWFATELAPEPDGWAAFLGARAAAGGGAAVRREPAPAGRALPRPGRAGGLAGAEQLHGKEMSYNNYVDTEAALRAVDDFTAPCVAIVKHTNPCGIAVAGADAGDAVADAHRKALACDPVSAFGGVMATNRPVTRRDGRAGGRGVHRGAGRPGLRAGRARGADAQEGDPAAAGRGPQCRAVECARSAAASSSRRRDLLAEAGDSPAGWTLAAGDPVDDATLADLAFAWRACRAVKSNAILLADGGATVGVGMGQVNRVDSARLAVSRAGDRAAGAVAASDAFFPFADGLQVLLDAGVRAVVQPGGSVRDEEVVAAAAAAGVALYLTGVRHFAH